MIAGFRDRWLEAFFVDGVPSKKIPGVIEDRLFRKLQLIDDAVVIGDLRVPPGNRIEKLQGNLLGWYSIRVNEQWRLIFQWNDGTGEAVGLYLDPHLYR